MQAAKAGQKEAKKYDFGYFWGLKNPYLKKNFQKNLAQTDILVFLLHVCLNIFNHYSLTKPKSILWHFHM